MEEQTTAYLQKLKDLKLRETSRTRMQDELLAYARFHPAGEGVRVVEGGRSIRQVLQSTSLFNAKKLSSMPIAILIAVLIGGGTSFAAQGAIPGDVLYPVKTEVNENVRSLLAISDDAEARLQVSLLKERIEEVQKLKAEGHFTGETATKAGGAVAAQSQAAESAVVKSDAQVQADLQSEVRLSLLDYNNVVADTDANLQVDINTLFAGSGDAGADMETDTRFGTTLATDEMSIEELQAMVKTQLDGLVKLVDRYQTKISTSVQAEFQAKFDQASELIVNAKAESEADARAHLNDAARLLGDVEAKLSTLGTVEVENGAIIDIDFSKIPLLNRNTEVESDSSTSAETESDADNKADTSVDVELNGSTSVNDNGATVGGDAHVGAMQSLNL